MRRPPSSHLFPYTTLFRSGRSPAGMRRNSKRASADPGEACRLCHTEWTPGISVLRRGESGGTRRGGGSGSKASVCSSLSETKIGEHTSELQSRQYLVCRLL